MPTIKSTYFLAILLIAIVLTGAITYFVTITYFAPQPKVTHELTIQNVYSAGAEKEAMLSLINTFMTSHPDYTIHNLATTNADQDTMLSTMIAGGEPPDMFQHGWRPSISHFVVDLNACKPLDDLWAELNLGTSLTPGLERFAKFGDHIYGIPYDVTTRQIWYNTKIFNRYNLSAPTTWDQFLTVCQTLKANGVTPLTWGTKSNVWTEYWFDVILLRVAGEDFALKLGAGQKSFLSPQVNETMQRWKEIMPFVISDAASYTWSEAASKLARGEAAMFLMGDWVGAFLTRDAGLTPITDFNCFRIPTINSSLPRSVIFAASDCFFVLKDAKNVEEAYEWQRFMVQPTTQPLFNNIKGAQNTVWSAAKPSDAIQAAIYDQMHDPAVAAKPLEYTAAFNYPLPFLDRANQIFAGFIADLDVAKCMNALDAQAKLSYGSSYPGT